MQSIQGVHMRILVDGDKGKAICDSCGLVSTTYQARDVPFSDNVGMAKSILVGVCDECDCVVCIPAQATPEIAQALQAALSTGR